MRNINELHPQLIEKVYQLIDLCEQNGITIGISECVRTVAEQDALYAKGRTAAGSIVTNAKGSNYSSMHQWGVAFDFFLKEDVDGDGQISDDSYNNATRLFDKVGALGTSIGLEWGGNWRKPVDKPHFQLPDWGSTSSKLKSIYGTPSAFMKTWKNVEKTEEVQNPKEETTLTSNGTAICTASSGLIVRASKDTESSRVTAIPYKKSCIVHQLNAGTADGLVWAKVTYGGKTGYCAQKYLNVTVAPATSTTNTATSQTTTNKEYSKSIVDSAKCKNAQFAGTYKTTSNLNLRTGAGTGKGIITTIPSGSEVQNYGFYTEVNGIPWYLVAYGKLSGYCSSKYLNKCIKYRL